MISAMYSGITKGLFLVTRVKREPGVIHYTVKLNAELAQGLIPGASVNIDGVCQTATKITDFAVDFSAMAETCRLTTLNELFTGRMVSVERSLRFGEEIGGHEIAGHVTGTATVSQITPSDNNLSLTLQCPGEWIKYILPKGFIAVDGSSLTVGDTNPQGFFTVHLIPETLRLTNFGNKKIGDRVNIELDRTTQAIVTTVERVLQSSSFSAK
jgi:riboflavin synthase